MTDGVWQGMRRRFSPGVARIRTRKSCCGGKDDEFGLGGVELVLPLGGQIGDTSGAAENVVCSWEMLFLLAPLE